MAIQGLFSGDLKVRGLNGVLVANDGIVTATSFSSGSSGTSGTAGSSGTSATSGTSGTSATSGTSGTTGTSGSAGTSGTTGSSGSSGTSGSSGSSATSGTSGTSATNGTGGTSGTSGSSGSTGTSGSSGSSGSSGTSATDGTGGTSGTSGSSATSGTSGSSATSGTAGTSGTSATAGTSGTSGVQGDRYATTSTTTFTLGNAGTLTVATQLAYTVAQSIIVVYDANNFQECEVTAYNPATGSLSFGAPFRTVGGGTYSAWTINLDGASGGDGSSGSSGSSGSAGTSGTTGTSGSSGSSGTTGTSGSSATSGTSGTTGRNGIDGSSGASIANWYGAFTSTANQVVTAANTATPITYTNVEISNGIVFSGSQITVQHGGVYEIAYSLQLEKTQGTAADADIWLVKNGTNIIRSDSVTGLVSNSTKQLPYVSIIDEANANDYYQVYFSGTTDHVQITAVVANGIHPAAPSIITNIKQIGIAVGTTSGTSGSSGSSGSSGTSGGTGSSGLSGSDGTSGSSGTSGGTGSSGSAGSSGTSGSSGTTGTSGSSGTAGSTGTSGTSGSSGSSGTTGTSGTSATSGTTGTSGSSGTSGNATTSARAVQTFTSTSGQTTFTVANGYNLGMVDVFVNGVKFVDGTDFTATNGTTVVMAAALAAGNIVEIDNLLTAYLPTNALRTITTFTATAAQTTFSVSYTQGLIDVFYNGSNLAQTEYTATNGTSIILATACQVNDIVVVYAYSYSVGAYSGIAGSGTINTIPKFTATASIGNSGITDDGTTVTLVSRALSGTSATFKVNADRNLAIKYDTNIAISAQADSGGPESLRMYADTFRIFTATTAVGLTERFTIANTGAATFSGNIGIGGVTLASWYTGYTAMQLGASASIFGNKTTADTNVTQLANNAYLNTAATNWQYINTDEATRYEQVNGEHNFYSVVSGSAGGNITWGTSKMTIASTGNVGIGASANANYRTYIAAPTTSGSSFGLYITAGTTSADTALAINNATDTASLFAVKGDGTVLLNTTTNPYGHRLIVQGSSLQAVMAKTDVVTNEVMTIWNTASTGNNIFEVFYTNSTITSRGSIDFNRAATLTRFNTTSDANLKNIIGDSDRKKSIEILNSTRIREYSWKEDETNKPQIGVIAQELYETFKGAVVEGSDSELFGTEEYKNWQVDKTAFTFHLIAGWQKHEQLIQEQQAQIEELKAIVATK